jgi:chromosome segregation ATPase
MEVEMLAGEVKQLEIDKRELAGEVAHLECKKRERELVAQVMSQEHETLVQRVLKLETELEEVRKSALEKDHLFEVNEQDQMEKTKSCFDHKHKLEPQKKKLEEKLHRQERKLVDADNTNSGGQWGGKNEPHSSRKSRAKALTSRTGMVNSPIHHTRYVSALLLCTQYGLKRSGDKNHTVRTCPMATVKCP